VGLNIIPYSRYEVKEEAVYEPRETGVTACAAVLSVKGYEMIPEKR
jgi:hypothetical protein